MELIIYLMSGVAILNCVVGLLTGSMYFFFKAPDEFIGSVRAVSRTDMPMAFWVFFVVTLSFGVVLARLNRVNRRQVVPLQESPALSS
ncbi:MAG: hypothetical protein RIC56_17020 [Pseudomonadales bacterium]